MPKSKKKSSKAASSSAAAAPEEEEKILKATGWDHVVIPDAKKAHFAITGNESQVLTMAMKAGDSCKGEPGTMMYLTNGMTQSVSCDGCCARCCAGEDCCVVNFTNEGGGSEEAYVALTPNFPTSKIIPIDMSSKDVNGSLIAQQGAFMASHGDVEVGMDLDCNLMRCCCGGMGLVRQSLTGSGTVFLAATGTIVQKVLKEGEVIVVDTNCVLAFAKSCKLEVKRAGNVVGMVGGGEGIFNTTLTGPGLVVVQSMNQLVFLQSLVALKIYRR